jgi:glycerol-3-phosphate acyltransferase PlsX
MRARIAVDAMGGDHAPDEVVKGAIRAQSELDVEVTLVGDPQRIQAVVRHLGPEYQIPMTIEPAEESVAMDEEAIASLRRKPRASINVAMNLVKAGKADAVVSAGHSGAVMAAGLLRLGRLPGIDRPALGALLPTRKPGKQVLILDVGANVDCRPKFLEQFAILGSIYSQDVLGVLEPRVGLLNIGEEASKGNDLALRTYDLLENNPHIVFAGNAEGRDVLTGQFDVVVCDGFVGNVLLKFAEAIGGVLLGIIKDELPRGRRGKIGARILRGNLKRIKQRIDHAEHGGALLLGVDGICIIGHGSSYAPSIYSAIRLAKTAVEHRIMDHLHQVKQWTEPDASASARTEKSVVS